MRASFFPPARIHLLLLSGEAARDACLVPHHRAPSSLSCSPGRFLVGFPHRSTSAAGELFTPRGLGIGGGGRQPEAGPLSQNIRRRPRKLSLCLSPLALLASHVHEAHPALHGPEAPSLPSPQLLLLVHVRLLFPHPSPSPKGVSAVSRHFHLWDPQDWSPGPYT